MGKYLDKFKKGKNKIQDTVKEIEESGKLDKKEHINERRFHHRKNERLDPVQTEEDNNFDDNESFDDDENFNDDNDFVDNGIGATPTQKSESFFHFILENQYKDLERSIRGLKDVWDKDTQQWSTKRKANHCFTDEEAEDILRTAQSHLATDIKLGRIKSDVFGDYMNALYKELAFLFESIAEYRYGRYNTFNKKTGKLIRVNYEKQYEMKVQNNKIFLELWTRIQANYSRSIGGAENISTHESVKGQESLQAGNRDYLDQRTGY